MLTDPRLHKFLLLSVCALALPAVLISQLNNKADGAFTSLQVEADGNLTAYNPRTLTFVWQPEISPETAVYSLNAQCSHQDRLGGPPGSVLRVVFKGSMTPLPSGTPHKLARKRAKLRQDGSQSRRVQWQDPVFVDLAGQGHADGVLVQMEIVLKGALSFGDIVTCDVGMFEASSRPIL